MRFVHGNIAVLDDSDQLSRWVEESGKLCHDDGVYMHYLPHIDRKRVVIDAGAALGDHTVAYAGHVGAGNVHAFECNPDMFECLVHNVPQCIGWCVALSDHDGELVMLRQIGNLGASMCVEASRSVPNSIQREYPVVVKCSTLDSFKIGNVGFIKWDIEGCEVAGLRGARETIMESRPKMMVEANEALLAVQGFTVADLLNTIDGMGYSIKEVMGDLEDERRAELLCLPR